MKIPTDVLEIFVQLSPAERLEVFKRYCSICGHYKGDHDCKDCHIAKLLYAGDILTQEEMSHQAKKRPANYYNLTSAQQWAIDKELGILDWDGD